MASSVQGPKKWSRICATAPESISNRLNKTVVDGAGGVSL
jgi:hypothetical protein